MIQTRQLLKVLSRLGFPIVIITAAVGVLRQGRALGMGVADYMVKPLSVASLRETVNRILGGKRGR